MTVHARTAFLALTAVAALAACGNGAPDGSNAGNTAAESASASRPASPAPGASAASPVAVSAGDAPADLPTILVYKSPACGCCEGWVEHMRAAGFRVDARNTDDLGSVKQELGVPEDMMSCHTALVGGYVVEGHVPANVLRRFLAERPDVVGISVPGMIVGSPGMEGPGAEPYSVMTFDAQGHATEYARVDPR